MSQDTSESSVGVMVKVGTRTVLTDSMGRFLMDSLSLGTVEVSALAEDRIFSPLSVQVLIDTADTASVQFLMLRRRQSDSVSMVEIGPSQFWMGNSASNQLYVDEAVPRHLVTITRPYAISAYEVTQRQWERLMFANPSMVHGEDLPVMNVIYDSVVVFCNRLSDLFEFERVYSGSGAQTTVDLTRNGFRLLTEAEWEYAASAGDTTALYNIDDPINQYSQADYIRVIKEINEYAWTEDNSGGAFGSPQNVGQLQPNAWGLFDMIGNAQELVEDTWSTYSDQPIVDPLIRNETPYRVARGSSFGHLLLQNHSIRYRESVRSAVGAPSIGFRIARTR